MVKTTKDHVPKNTIATVTRLARIFPANPSSACRQCTLRPTHGISGWEEQLASMNRRSTRTGSEGMDAFSAEVQGLSWESRPLRSHDD
ncbi:hypothetical protein ON010_g8519 [Phytophthora cinnamomi]|nr:hypothetical protein ON010_g8519 [Phytophthora cinnamomi]